MSYGYGHLDSDGQPANCYSSGDRVEAMLRFYDQLGAPGGSLSPPAWGPTTDDIAREGARDDLKEAALLARERLRGETR